MSSPKLILLEGIPGSGKSSAGEFVQGLLQRQGVAVRFWREGDFDHPADFEGVAGLSEATYRDLLARYPHLAALIQQHTDVRGADYLLSHRKLQHNHLEAMRQKLEVELLAELPLPSLVIEHAGQEWDRCNAAIDRFIGAHLTA